MGGRSTIDDERQFALWSIKRARTQDSSRRVLIAHKDKSVGESLAVMLRLKGLQVILSQDLKAVRSLVQNWKPQALILDTSLDSESGYVFIRTLRMDADITGRLLVAMSDVWPADPIETLKDAGFDAHCRRPCSTWRIVDLVDAYFSAPAVSKTGAV
ncbi:Response regulators consisting of a CheY-like receiver domain and a winged-helix DNA-binding domain [Caballeronia glathei]|jgi:DNA-binding response OmpR family regulator|uniref:Histidine kinase n=1 Tax=Caballeronia glathei TaxID=60547 RepID=A0A069PQS8_9BURK|nr:response regulator transcription factor [Caballeronia glathei]KDR42980.1 histidine kinase [Caballeronia glathei]CDY75358.1 Response regulators consisting of a CheY-like receiver domain and a winged-helix DNA-binding domain [Caballeronia glathei]